VSSEPTRAQPLVVVGRVIGPFGVRGWLRVRSYTRPAENILAYSPWYLAREGSDDEANDAEVRRVVAGEVRGEGVVAQIEGVADRDTASALGGSRVMVPRSRFPATGTREFYWADLEGLEVRTAKGELLGRVQALLETGANDVMVVQGERRRLIPFILDVTVRDVRLDEGVVIVDWEPEF